MEQNEQPRLILSRLHLVWFHQKSFARPLSAVLRDRPVEHQVIGLAYRPIATACLSQDGGVHSETMIISGDDEQVHVYQCVRLLKHHHDDVLAFP